MTNPATGVSSQLGTLSPLKRDGSTVGQRATYEELAAALKEYGNHPQRCTYWNSDTAPCDCGLDAVLAKVSE